MSAPSPPPPEDIPFAERLGSPKTFAYWVIPTVLGLLAAVVFHLLVVMPRFGTGSPDLDRMIAIGQLLDSPLNSEPTLVCVGDSTTVEGIDASIIAQAAPKGWRVLNLGINGGDRAELNVIIPKVAAAKPKAVCLVLRPAHIGDPPDVEVDSSYAYNLGGFPAAWPAGWMTPNPPGVPPDKIENLTATHLDAHLNFRTAFQQLINNKLREQLRRGIRPSQPTNFVAPFNLTMSISGSTLESHLRNLDEENQKAIKFGTAKHEADMERLIAYLHSQGVTPILIAAPTHPGLREAFGPTNARMTELAKGWAQKYAGIYGEATLLFDESGFADAQHLNEKGRRLLSEFVGKLIPPPT